MTEDFVSMKDKIILAAIELISDGGLASVATKNVARRVNIDESMLYKFYGNMDDLIKDSCKAYFHFDEALFRSAASKPGTRLDKIRYFFEAYATYYDNYYALSTIALHFEELLHNPETRDCVIEGINRRREFLAGLFQEAIYNHEIRSGMDGGQLADVCLGYFSRTCLNRRIGIKNGSFKSEIIKMEDAFFRLLT